MRLKRAEKNVILECLKTAWNQADDRKLFEEHEREKENIRLDLIKRFERELR